MSRGFFKKISNNASLTDELLPPDTKHPKRPASIDFLGFRGRLNTLDKISPLPTDTIMDGLTLSSGKRIPVRKRL